MRRLWRRIMCWLGMHYWHLEDVELGSAIYVCEACDRREVVNLYGPGAPRS